MASKISRARFSSFVSDHVYNRSDSTGIKYIFQPFCLGIVSCSSKVANSKSEPASSRCGGKPSDGSAQSVHSRAMLKLPRSNSRSRRVSIPAIRRAFKTWKHWPRSGWNGWRISAHPKCELRSGSRRSCVKEFWHSWSQTGRHLELEAWKKSLVFREVLEPPAGVEPATC